MAIVRFLSFNIWFSEYEMEKRMQAIGDIIQATEPHVVALQEMTETHWQVCQEHPAFRRYFWSPPGRGYYTMLGSIRPFLTQPQRIPFRASNMKRDILMARVAVGNSDEEAASLPPLVFGTSHLESLDFYHERRLQAQESLRALESLAEANDAGGYVKDLVFCGDTNINEKVDGRFRLPSSWQDAWLEVHRGREPEDLGFTFDALRNQMVWRMDGWARNNRAQLRYDRFWVRLSRYMVTQMELLGTETIQGDDPAQETPVWPSDHFGVLMTLALAEENCPRKTGTLQEELASFPLPCSG